MVYFHTKNMLVYFLAIRNVYGPLVYLVAIWYVYPPFGLLYQETSGNPRTDQKIRRVPTYKRIGKKLFLSSIFFSTRVSVSSFCHQDGSFYNWQRQNKTFKRSSTFDTSASDRLTASCLATVEHKVSRFINPPFSQYLKNK
jgi:hypothetical protein